MIQAVTSNDTASSATSKAIDSIVENLHTLTENLPSLKPILAPSENAIRSLHNFANDESPIKDNEGITAAFQEIGEQVAYSLRSLRKGAAKTYEKTLDRLAEYTGKISNFFSPKATRVNLSDDSVSEETIKDLVTFSEEQNGAVLMNSTKSLPAFSIRLDRGKQYGTQDFEIKKPIDLFKYINFAYQRNKLMGKPLDSRIKCLVYLAHCVKETIESQGSFSATYKELSKDFNYHKKDLAASVRDWNTAIECERPDTLIGDYNSPLAPEEIARKDAVLSKFNEGKGRTKQIDTVMTPEKMRNFLKLTKEMDQIKPFYRKTKSSDTNQRFKYLDLVMQWYMQLDSEKPKISIAEFSRSKASSQNQEVLARRIAAVKSEWNAGRYKA